MAEQKDNRCDQITFFGYKKVLKSRGEMQFKVITDSMVPLIKPEEMISVIPQEEFQKFDVVVYWDGEKLVSHYIWHRNRVDDQVYVTRSLKSPNSDDIPVNSQHILGLVNDRQLSLWQKLKILIFKSIKKSPS